MNIKHISNTPLLHGLVRSMDPDKRHLNKKTYKYKQNSMILYMKLSRLFYICINFPRNTESSSLVSLVCDQDFDTH